MTDSQKNLPLASTQPIRSRWKAQRWSAEGADQQSCVSYLIKISRPKRSQQHQDIFVPFWSTVDFEARRLAGRFLFLSVHFGALFWQRGDGQECRRSRMDEPLRLHGVVMTRCKSSKGVNCENSDARSYRNCAPPLEIAAGNDERGSLRGPTPIDLSTRRLERRVDLRNRGVRLFACLLLSVSAPELRKSWKIKKNAVNWMPSLGAFLEHRGLSSTTGYLFRGQAYTSRLIHHPMHNLIDLPLTSDLGWGTVIS